ncbi:MAG: hypothetical protein ACK5NY_08935 [Burkholderiaceae bacterium]
MKHKPWLATSTPKHLERLRQMSVFGKPIPMHHALRTLDFPRHRWFEVLLLPAVFTLLLLLAWPTVNRYWAGWMDALLLDLVADLQFSAMPVWFHHAALEVPMIFSALPSKLQWWAGWGGMVLLVLLPAFLPERWTVLNYCLGWAAVLQLGSQIVYFFLPHLIHYSVGDYLATMLQSSFVLMLGVPWLLATSFNIFPFRVAHKISLCAGTLFALFVLTPVQYALQALILEKGSMLWTPLLFFGMGLPLSVLVVIGMYCWAVTWGADRNR